MREGSYDEVNHLCSELVDRYDWGFVSINLRPYYAEGPKTQWVVAERSQAHHYSAYSLIFFERVLGKG